MVAGVNSHRFAAGEKSLHMQLAYSTACLTRVQIAQYKKYRARITKWLDMNPFYSMLSSVSQIVRYEGHVILVTLKYLINVTLSMQLVWSTTKEIVLAFSAFITCLNKIE